MGLKGDALLADLTKLCQGKNLKPAGIGKNRAIPPDELMQPAQGIYHLVGRSDMQMIGIGKLNLAADFFEILRGDAALDRTAGADIHENGRFDCAVRRCEAAAPGCAFGF